MADVTLSVTETISVAELVTRQNGNVLLSATDSLTVAESQTLLVGVWAISITESVGLVEVVTAQLSALSLSVVETIAVTDIAEPTYYSFQPRINLIRMPDTLFLRGMYRFYDPEQRINGDGTTVSTKGHTLEWTWDHINITEWTWLKTTLFGDATSVAVTEAQLWANDNRTGKHDFTHGVAYLNHDRAVEFQGYAYRNVTLLIEFLFPLVDYS